MALQTLPNDIHVTRSDLMFRTPGDTELSSIYGAGSQSLGRGQGFYSGVLGFKISDFNSQDVRRYIELLLVRLRNVSHTLRVPLNRPSGGSLAGGTALTVSSSLLSGGTLTVTVTGAATGLIAGDYVQISGRLYILDTDLDANQFQILPLIKPTDGDPIVWEDVYAIGKVDRESDGIVSPHTPDFSGPWSIPWNEVID